MTEFDKAALERYEAVVRENAELRAQVTRLTFERDLFNEANTGLGQRLGVGTRPLVPCPGKKPGQ